MSTNSQGRGWWIWGICALFMFYKYGLEVSPSIMTGTLMKAFSLDGVQLGNLAASYFYAYLLLQIPAGLLLDRFGPKRVTSIALFVSSIGCMVFALAPSLGIAMLGRFLTGVGAAFAAVTGLKLISNWFSYRQFAFMAGLLFTVAMLGAVGGQAPLAAFIGAVGWRQALGGIAFFGIFLTLLFFIIVKDSPKKRTLEETPEVSLLFSLKSVVQRGQSWWLSIYCALAFAPIMVFGGLWGVSFLSEAYHLTHPLAAQMVSLIFIGFAVGSPFLGWFSDWLKRRKIVLFWCTLMALICMGLVIYVPSISQIHISGLLFLFGFFISSFVLSISMMREVNHILFAATAVGFMNALNSVVGAISDPLSGWILDLTWGGKMVDGIKHFSASGYRTAFLIIPIYLILALVSLLWVKETHCDPVEPEALP